MAQKTRIAVTPGDGIGPEVVAEAVHCLETLRKRHDLPMEWTRFPWPSHAWHEENGESMPADALDQLKSYDAILLGALGDPGPVDDPDRYLLPDSISLAPLLDMRKGFDQWVCERPARLLPGARQYLADERAKDIDMLVIRENSEGEYVSQGGRLRKGAPDEVATQMEVFTRRATDRIIRYGFEQARLRAAARAEEGRTRHFRTLEGKTCESQVCIVTKRNALRYWGDMYTEAFEEMAKQYPDVATHHELVDAACMKFVQAPWAFDVVVASNLQGDILTDLAAVLSGGMGVAPSCNLNPDENGMPSMFEPTHGSAPDIAGQGLADPTAMLFTTARMLEWLGRKDPAVAAAGRELFDAVAADLAENAGKSRGTQEIGAAVRERLESLTRP
ncbi:MULTISPECIES: isocitrate/isopropylmalate dehydrogenase family protein [Marinobacter]|jgi:tartrate dehydrogenase/decarboxylase/D-malate dehydrogenase|uniref:isocitrate/isopropylmalate dehydrogenase family protein n=1 Tax=Marinobacter TaxID=2742 RepID=UPI0009490AF5|nr:MULTISPECIES: isocitrate/isopropylmalate family dehydrogenase [Marinobacter]MCZ4284808.1 isocitrate/isopropylmalate family dehydrogenase [Marinobacter salarius]MDC8455062.1 isocitrate/isopropylmalate dehydrogenase family protein [Marinobacter sp. DS40M6]MDM8179933.1 isocitrate/isopropylmalate family dehydrogenase [Marinobacter salarius]OLF83165.1 3-isopropylmalate dehydrogenase [Marinobacter sp. C18]RUT73906.1 isocitrate/isopropylmalate dehydrogenase family protein [Marinobacter sp. NP-6]|tara:strand:- start:3202 stop:4368 length:1167 start_codon:yes stop_codon:yes gene_type:complete